MITIYTAIFGDYDWLKEPNFVSDDIKYVCFTDQDINSEIWEIRKVERTEEDPRREARKYKILSHDYIDTDISIWIDGSYQVYKNPIPHVEMVLKEADLVCSIHSSRFCLYDEARHCIKVNKGDSEKITKQVEKYEKEGYPKKNGLIYSSVLLRKKSPKLEKFEDDWWKEICENSVRDQISFNYIVWKNSITFKYWSWRTFIKIGRHKNYKPEPTTPKKKRKIKPSKQEIINLKERLIRKAQLIKSEHERTERIRKMRERKQRFLEQVKRRKRT